MTIKKRLRIDGRTDAVIVRVGSHRWAVVIDYGHPWHTGYRTGCWAADADPDGGWGVATEPLAAIRECWGGPVTYRTLREAMAEVEERRIISRMAV